MEKCTVCESSCNYTDQNCGACNSHDDISHDFISVSEEAGFKESYFSVLAKLEDYSFWFRARNRLIIWALGDYCSKLSTFLEIGCGTGYVLSGIAKAYPNVNLEGSELFEEGLKYARDRLPSINLMQMDARKIPFISKFNSIGAFDVLEHIEEDTAVLTQIHKALKPQGLAIFTVPQHTWLWSPADDYACHVRRYFRNELEFKLKKTGFEILRSTSFVSCLLPVMLASRISQKFISKKHYDPLSEFRIPSWLNFIFEMVLNAEIKLIKCGVNFPLGGSRLIVAKKI